MRTRIIGVLARRYRGLPVAGMSGALAIAGQAGRRRSQPNRVPLPIDFRALVLPALFLGVVAPAGSIAVSGHFDGLYGQDPFAYLDYALGPLRQSLVQLQPPPPFYWPPGYPLLVVVVSFVVGMTPLAGQLVSLAAGGLVPVFTALLAGEVWEPLPNPPRRGEGEDDSPLAALPSPRRGGAGGGVSSADQLGDSPGASTHRSARSAEDTAVVALVAGLVTALNPQLWQSSVVVMSDTTGLALATAAAWALARYGRRRRVGWLMLAAGALAGAVATRWAYALVAIPCALFAVFVLMKSPLRAALAHAAIAALLAGVILTPVMVPVTRGLLTPTGGVATFATDLQVYSWNPLNAIHRHFVTADGVLDYHLPNGLYYALAPAHPFFFTPLLAWLIVPGCWVLARRRGLASRLLILGWVAVIFGFHAGAAWQNFRFTLAYLPPLAVLVAIGGSLVSRSIARLRFGRWLAAFVLCAGLIWMTYGGITLTRGFVERKDADLSTARWVQTQLPPKAVLLTFGLTLTVRHYTAIDTVDLSEIGPNDLSILLARPRPVFVLLNIANVETQWAGRSPDENFLSLQSAPGLRSIGRRGDYELDEARGLAQTTAGMPVESTARRDQR